MSNIQEEEEFLGKFLIIVGPSGAGKTSVLEGLRRQFPGFIYAISTTTRNVRKGEEDGVDKNFVSKKEFEKMINAGEFLEYAHVFGDNYYGTPKKMVFDALKQGAFVVKDIDVQGFDSISEILDEKNLISVFIDVGDEEELKKRIELRGEMDEAELKKRMETMRKEMIYKDKCKYVVKNEWGYLSRCVGDIATIVLDELKDMY